MSDKQLLFQGKEAGAPQPQIDYGVNFLWLNESLVDAPLLWGKGLSKGQMGEVKKIYLNLEDTLKNWRKCHPNAKKAEINLWYDSHVTTPKAINNTKKLLSDYDINFRDIHEMSCVRDNPRLFEPTMPLMWKIDLLKLVICAHCMENYDKQSAIFSDFSIGFEGSPVPTYEHLYEGENLHKLETMGMLVGKTGLIGTPENQFIQTLNTPELLASLKHTINSIILQTADYINIQASQERPVKSTMYNLAFQATVSHTQMYHLCKKETEEKILVRADIVKEGTKDDWIAYEPTKHGSIFFGNHHAYTYDWEAGKRVKIIDEDGEKIYRRTEVFKVPAKYALAYHSLKLEHAHPKYEDWTILGLKPAWPPRAHIDKEVLIEPINLAKDIKLLPLEKQATRRNTGGSRNQPGCAIM